MKFSRAEIERCIKYGDITSNGVVFHWELSGPDGAHFFLIKDRGITTNMINAAKRKLRWKRDVTGFTVAEVEEDSAVFVGVGI